MIINLLTIVWYSKLTFLLSNINFFFFKNNLLKTLLNLHLLEVKNRFLLSLCRPRHGCTQDVWKEWEKCTESRARRDREQISSFLTYSFFVWVLRYLFIYFFFEKSKKTITNFLHYGGTLLELSDRKYGLFNLHYLRHHLT